MAFRFPVAWKAANRAGAGGEWAAPPAGQHVRVNVTAAPPVPQVEQAGKAEPPVGYLAGESQRELGLIVTHHAESTVAVPAPDLRGRASLLDEPGAVREPEAVGRRERRNRQRGHDADVTRKRNAGEPTQVGGAHREGRDGDLPPPVPDLGARAAIEDALRIAGGWRQGLLQNQVRIVLLVPRRRDRDTRIEQPGLEAGFDLLLALRVERRIREHPLNGDRVLATVREARKLRELLTVQRLIARFTVGHA